MAGIGTELATRIRFALEPSERAAKSAFNKHVLPLLLEAGDEIIHKIITGAGSAVPGSRCFPPKKDDAKFNIRFDWGVSFEDAALPNISWRQIDLQINSNAEQATLRALARRDSHMKRAVLSVPFYTNTGEVVPSAQAKFRESYRILLAVCSETGI